MKEFDLARSFISDPRKEIDHFAMPLKFALQQTQSVSPEMMQETLVRIYVKKVNLLLQIFTGMGDEEASVAAHQKARFFERTPVPEWSPVSIIAGA